MVAYCEPVDPLVIPYISLVQPLYIPCLSLIHDLSLWKGWGFVAVFPTSGHLAPSEPIERDGAQTGLSNGTRSGRVGCGKAMKAKSVILSVLCATAVVGVAILLAVEYHARLQLSEENTALPQQ